MALAAVYVMNRLPHPQSKVRRRRAASPYELVYRRKPDLSDLIAGPGELVVVDWIGAKASAGEQTGEHCYYIMPTGAGHLVRSFRTLKTKVTKSVRTLTAPGQTVQSLVSLRHTLQAGVFRDGSGLAGAPASAVVGIAVAPGGLGSSRRDRRPRPLPGVRGPHQRDAVAPHTDVYRRAPGSRGEGKDPPARRSARGAASRRTRRAGDIG